MSERVLHEWTDSESIIRIVEDDRGFFGWSAESGIVSDLIPIVFCKELARLDARVSELEAMYETSHASRMHAEDCVTRLEAEVAVLSGTACAEEQAEGNGPCGACRTCRNKRITELEAENAKLKESLERMVRIYHEQRTELDNTREERNNAQYEAVEAKAKNAKLRKCVGAADSEIDAWREWGARIGGDERVCGWVHQEDYGLYCLLADPPVSDIPYDRARAEVDK